MDDKKRFESEKLAQGLLPNLHEKRKQCMRHDWHRIVARVDQLMSLCDELEAGLLRSQADSERLMEVVVGRMLAGGDRVEEQTIPGAE